MIGVIYGGESLEHEVSIETAKCVQSCVPSLMIYIDKAGRWQVDGKFIENILPVLKSCEVVFPLVHGAYGENGTLQGFLEMNKIPYIGCGVRASALCMDKDLTKRVLESHGIKTVPFKTYFSLQEALEDSHAFPFVVKAADLGSSFGVYKVTKDYESAFKGAFALSEKVMKEELITGREIWCSILEDVDNLIASSPGEIIPTDEMFTYENKYTEGGAVYHMPAKNVDSALVQDISKKAFKVLGCSGMVRVDLFITEQGEVLVNELNTLPGFKDSSLFCKTLIHDGMSYKQIIEALAVKAKLSKDESCHVSCSKEGMPV